VDVFDVSLRRLGDGDGGDEDLILLDLTDGRDKGIA
jgi:hypothetical protein